MLGLYKVEFQTIEGSDSGVIYAQDGKLLGGNSAFAFIGSCAVVGDEISAEISTQRHNQDPTYRPLFGIDRIRLILNGRRQGDQLHCEGGAADAPGITVKSIMTPISDEARPRRAATGQDGIRNGLYSIHTRMLDGIEGGDTGVMVLHDGRIHGGDSYFDYVGCYTCTNGRWKGEVVNREHTPRQRARPAFGGRDVGVGFSGTYTDTGASGEATALAGKRSVRFSAVLKLLAAM